MLKALRFAILFFVLAGLVYPLAITGLSQLLFPYQANGSLLKDRQGHVIGSVLMGQNFTRPEYFHPRPSANHYDAANSGGSNLGPTNKKLIDRIQQSAIAYQTENNWHQPIPIDAVTTSASGLDPHISLANALAQSARVATVRRLSLESVKQLVLSMAEYPLLSENSYVNVLTLNLALDGMKDTIKRSYRNKKDMNSYGSG